MILLLLLKELYFEKNKYFGDDWINDVFINKNNFKYYMKQWIKKVLNLNLYLKMRMIKMH